MIQIQSNFQTTALKYSNTKVNINDLTGFGQCFSRWSQLDAIVVRFINAPVKLKVEIYKFVEKIRQILDTGLYIDFDETCLLYTSPSPRDLSTSRMPSSA